MSITAQSLIELKSPYLKHLSGPLSARAQWVYPPEHCKPEGLSVASQPEQIALALKNKVSILVVVEELNDHASLKSAGVCVFTAPSVSVAFAVILPLFSRKQERFPVGIHSSAVVAPSAKIGQNVKIGPYAVIGTDARIGDNCIIASHSVVEANAKLGNNCILHAHVFIGADCELGNNCEIHPFTCVGSDGFGFVQAPDKTRHKIPQIGKVIIEDDVEIGSLCAIDRATIFETRICKGTKLDNHIHIAHNCRIGENSALAAGLMTAGSTTIGANFMTAGMVGVADHLTITDNVTIGAKSGVTKDIKEPGTYVGYPVVPFKEGLRNMSTGMKLYQIKRDLQIVLEHLKLESKD